MKLTTTLAAFVAALILPTTSALAREAQPFDAATFQAARAEGKTVLVDFAASWCPTCQKQGPAIARVLQEPKFRDVVAFKADFDRESDLKKQLKVTGQSTLVVFKGQAEAGRARGITDPAAIGDLVSKGL